MLWQSGDPAVSASAHIVADSGDPLVQPLPALVVLLPSFACASAPLESLTSPPLGTCRREFLCRDPGRGRGVSVLNKTLDFRFVVKQESAGVHGNWPERETMVYHCITMFAGPQVSVTPEPAGIDT